MEDPKTIIKPGNELTDDEIRSIDASKAREWKLPEMDQEHKEKHLFVLLKDKNNNILSQGQLYNVRNVKFHGEVFNLVEIGGIIANTKNEGYGRKLLDGIKEYLKINNITGIGFTGNEIIGFYTKCGFSEDHTSIDRFVNYQEFTEEVDDCIFYIDSSDKFMQKVLDNPKETVYLPK
ncbi:MAG TPA: GNAT family N-acetyltransferase [Bacteroidia bacterium]|nr:GNAT family N-acetyltransferase [Bacteroidia bacterium]